MNCQNCKTQLGCQCEVRTATDGTKCCRLCIDRYQNNVNLIKAPSVNVQPGAPIIDSVFYNPPKI